MSNVAGTIDFSIAFTDTTSVETKTVAKTITLSESKEATGTAVKVAIISGTVGTASLGISFDPTSYRNASGDFVAFASSSDVYRLSIQSNSESGLVQLSDSDLGQMKLLTSGGAIASSLWGQSDAASGVNVQNLNSGTADFTIVVTKE
jgi:hypothetical protein